MLPTASRYTESLSLPKESLLLNWLSHATPTGTGTDSKKWMSLPPRYDFDLLERGLPYRLVKKKHNRLNWIRVGFAILVGILFFGFLFQMYEHWQWIQIQKQITQNPHSSSCYQQLTEKANWLDQIRYQLWEDDRSERCIEYHRTLNQSSIPNPLTVLYHMLPQWNRWDRFLLLFFLLALLWIYHRV